MSTNHHTPYQDSVTTFEDSDMNAPLAELDSAIGDFSGNQGRIPRVNSGETALEYFDASYDVGGSFIGSPGASAVMMRFPFVRDINFPANLVGSHMIAATAATAETVFSIKKNGVQIFTATFAIGGTVATFSGSETLFQNNDILTLEAPASPDATLGDLGWCFALEKNIYTYTTTTTTTTSSSSSTTTTS